MELQNPHVPSVLLWKTMPPEEPCSRIHNAAFPST